MITYSRNDFKDVPDGNKSGSADALRCAEEIARTDTLAAVGPFPILTL
jgi:hypothetical protein